MKVNHIEGGYIHHQIYEAATGDLPVESIELTPDEWKSWTYFLIQTGRRSPQQIAESTDVINTMGVPVKRGRG